MLARKVPSDMPRARAHGCPGQSPDWCAAICRPMPPLSDGAVQTRPVIARQLRSAAGTAGTPHPEGLTS
eukprot:1940225-Pyramimonas_sp.AAC.1